MLPVQKKTKRDIRKRLPVVMAINDDYVLYAGVTIQSIKEHVSKNKFYDIYVMYTDLNTEAIKKLEVLSEEYFHVNCIDVHQYLNGYVFEDKMNEKLWHISKETFYRLHGYLFQTKIAVVPFQIPDSVMKSLWNDTKSLVYKAVLLVHGLFEAASIQNLLEHPILSRFQRL